MAPGAAAGAGPQNIQHAPGVAPAQGTDPDSALLLDAQGNPNTSYSLFDVHLRVQGAGRFTPLAANSIFQTAADGAQACWPDELG